MDVCDRNCFNCRMFEEIDAECGVSYCHRLLIYHQTEWKDPYDYYTYCWTGWHNGMIIEASPNYWEDLD